MILFNELKITTDGKHLVIDASVRDDTYYTDVYIANVKVDSQDTFSSTGPSANPIYTYTEISSISKRIQLQLTSANLSNVDLSKTLFFVYITVKGTPAADTPCGMDNVTTLGVTFDLYSIYTHNMKLIGEIKDNCTIPDSLADAILKLDALNMALRSANYTQAITYWKDWFAETERNYITSGCGCNG